MELNLKVVSREINQLMWSSNKTISTAESCSAGRISSILTSIAGSSVYFKGGLVCYADELKVKYLHVDEALIQEKSAVCEEVAQAMIRGAIEMFGSDYAVAMTGFAGPTGGTEESPVGTIWIAIGSKDEIVTFKQTGDEGREANISRAEETAMTMLRDFLKEKMEKE